MTMYVALGTHTQALLCAHFIQGACPLVPDVVGLILKLRAFVGFGNKCRDGLRVKRVCITLAEDLRLVLSTHVR